MVLFRIENCWPETGLLDLCGNVWEWTATPWSEGEAWEPSLGSADGAPQARRVVRGGSWNNTQGNARLGYRNNNDPDNRNNELGFRVCRASHIFTRLLMAVCVVCGRRVPGVR
jgi:formylglycine-generating enzyme required for sulfatase activity